MMMMIIMIKVIMKVIMKVIKDNTDRTMIIMT